MARYPAPGSYRCSFTLPQDLALNISHCAKRLHISQSALLSVLFEEPLQDLRKLVDLLPETIGGADVQRLRGTSEALIRERVKQALRTADAIGAGDPNP
jgi:hypothetical protein